MSLIDALRARARLILQKDDAELRMRREFDFHIEMETNRLIRDEQLSPSEARRQALVGFGGVEKHKEELRGQRGLAWMSGLSLDLKLGFRMLIKYPGLTIVGCLALSTAIAASSAYLEVMNDTISPALPGDFDQRIVRIRSWDVLKHELDPHPLSDFKTWREQLKSVEDLGAFTNIEPNFVTGVGQAEPLRGVAVSATAFRLLPTRPLLGRTLTAEDERLSAPEVVVVGERIWRSRLGANAHVVGTIIRLGNTPHTVVGVMPESFGFPVNYALWVPLKLDAMKVARGQGPMIGVFGRLAPGATVERVQAELTAMGVRAAREYPRTNANVRPRVSPFLEDLLASGSDMTETYVYYAGNLVFILFLCVCGANVATLVFARTATRDAEMVVRMSLGASRGRIVAQLFCEALALTSVSAVIGLVATAVLLKRVRIALEHAVGAQVPFWWNDNLSSRTLLYAVALALFGAIVIGVIPALKATGQHIGARLKASASGNSSLRFGKLWTGVIVSQVTLTVLFLMAMALVGFSMQSGRFVRGTFSFATTELLTFSAQMDGAFDGASPVGSGSNEGGHRFLEEYHATSALLHERLLSQPGIVSVTYASVLPSQDQAFVAIEVDGISRFPTGDSARIRVQSAKVGTTFFETLKVPVIAGRAFTTGDTVAGRNAAIVDQRFAHRVLGDRNPVGVRFREVRYVDDRREKVEYGEWREIIGVVNELAPLGYEAHENGVVYQAASVEATYPAFTIARVQGDTRRYVAAVRNVAAMVDASLRLYDVVPFEETGATARLVFWSLMRVFAVIGAIALMLSTAGVHALMAFTVSRRTREIGIRSALGASRNAIVRDTFSRAFVQVGAGILAGLIPGALLVIIGPPELAVGMGLQSGLATSMTIATFVIFVAGIACALPVWRAVCIEPTEALRQAG
ncbi:MAG: ABC transporter permease [Gemmatimonas sp.]